MNYYDSNDRMPRTGAFVAAAIYALTLAVSFAFVSFDIHHEDSKKSDTILVEFTEPEPVEPTPVLEPATEPRVHEKASPTEQTAQVTGKDEKTQSPNPKAMFKMNKGGPDEPADVGNPHAPQGEDKARGKGPGLSVDGLDQLDRGLQGRGLRGALPHPAYPGDGSGKVVVRVTVNASGNVTSASYDPKGSTTGDAALIEAALTAARKAKFTENQAPVQGGSITYLFKLN